MQLNKMVPNRLIAIENFLSVEECQSLIERANEIGFEAASVGTKHGAQMRTDIRNNERAIFDDEALAAQIWKRVSPFVPSPLFSKEAVELGSRWRFYRYEAGQVFKKHQDSSVKLENGLKSQMTLLLYLNEGCKGGQTRFYLNDREEPLNFEPKTGAALLFCIRSGTRERRLRAVRNMFCVRMCFIGSCGCLCHLSRFPIELLSGKMKI